MKILNIQENNFTKDYPLMNLVAYEICWDFIIIGTVLELFYKIIEDKRKMGELDRSLNFKQQINSMIVDLRHNYHSYAFLCYYLPAANINSRDMIQDTIHYRQDMSSRIVIIKGEYFGFESLRKSHKC